MGKYGAHRPMVTPLNCSKRKIGKQGFGVQLHWRLLFLFRLPIHGVRGDLKGSESEEVGKGPGHSEPGPARVQHLHFVPLICKYSLTLAGSNGAAEGIMQRGICSLMLYLRTSLFSVWLR